MAATDPQSLLNSSDVSCYECGGQATLYKLALLRQILLALNPMAATDPQSLLNSNDVSCYECFYSPWLLELALLRQISIGISGGGGGGTSGLLSSGPADPVADPGVANAAYRNTTTGVLWWWTAPGPWA